MEFRNKNILLVSPEPWDHIFVSKHHYAINLARKGNKTFFLNPPSNHNSINPTNYTNLFSVNYKGFIKGLRFMPSFMQKNHILNVYNELEKVCNTQFDVIWSFDNSVFFDFSALPKEILKISHIVDLNQDFQTELAASTADICLAVSKNILKKLEEFNKNIYFINHGYNLPYEIKNIEMPGNSQVKVVYAGNLSMPYIDWEVLNYIVELNKEVDFVFIGPGNDDFKSNRNNLNDSKRQCLNRANVFKIGKISSNELHNWYKRSDALIVSYQEKYHSQQSNPHKMMEYFGSGKVIIATKTEEYKLHADQQAIAMSNNNNEFPVMFNKVTKELNLWNNKEKQQERISYALENTYEKQIAKIEILIYGKREE